MDDKLEEEDPFGCELLPKRVSPGAEMDAYERAYGPPSLENIGVCSGLSSWFDHFMFHCV